MGDENRSGDQRELPAEPAVLGTSEEASTQALRKENEYLKSFHATIQGLMSRVDLNDLLKAIVIRAGELVGTRHGFIYLVDPGSGDMEIRIGLGLHREAVGFRLRPGEGLSGKVWQTGEPMVVDDYRSWSSRVPDARFDHVLSLVAVPLKSESQVVGVIGLGRREHGMSFGQEDVSILTRFAELACIALDNARLYEDLQRELGERAQAEKALRQSEEKFRMLFEKSGDAIILLDGGKVVDCNQAAVAIMGCSGKEQLLGRYTGELSSEKQPDGRDSFEKATELRTTAFLKGTLRFEWLFKKMNGREFPVEVLLTAIPLDDKQILYAVLRDISDRKAAEQALRESEERFRKLADEASFEGIIIHDGVEVLDVNRQFYALYGYGPGEIIGRDPIDTIAPESRDMVRAFIRERYGKTYEATAFRKDGSRFPIQINAKTIPFHGKRVRAAAIRDISREKRAEASLREEKERFRILVEESPLGVALIGKEDDTKYINPAFIRMFGYPLEEIMRGKDWFRKAYPDPEYRQSVLSSWLRDMKHPKRGEVQPKVFRVTCKDGSKKIIRFRPVAMESGEHLVIYEDITESRRLQNQLQQAQKMEAIGTLAGGIAHDFNNILGAIIGYTELAQDGLPEGSPAHRDLEQVLKAGTRAKELVNQILTFSRQTEQQIKPLRVHLILKEALKLLRASLPSSIEIRQRIEAVESTVMADPTQVHQVLLNLCTNAAHAMRQEGGVLEVAATETVLEPEAAKTYSDLNPGPYLSLIVSDTGHGMRPEVMERIFDPYFSTKPIGEGTGLGLAVVHGVVKSCGGAITVKSLPGEGTTFHILLPRVESGIARESDSHEPIPGGNERILFVDDEELIADIAGQQLTSLGYEVVTRTSSVGALELFRAKPTRFDLVITDQTMPNMTGSALAQALMAIRPDIPIILCTGFSELITEEKASAVGIRRFIKKPISKKEMAMAIRKVLDGKGLEEET